MKFSESHKSYLILLIISIIAIVVGAYLTYIFKRYWGEQSQPPKDRVEIICRSAVGKNTYEIPFYFGVMDAYIPISLDLCVNRNIEFSVDAERDIYGEKKKTNIGTIKANQGVSAVHDFQVQYEKLEKFLELSSLEKGEIISFEVIASTFLPEFVTCRKKIHICFCPWLHEVKLSRITAYENGKVDCDINVQNDGALGRFIVICELWKYTNGDQRQYQQEGRIVTDKNDEVLIELDTFERRNLKTQTFRFRNKGKYLLKTYVVKYQEYLMKDWIFWKKAVHEKIDYDEIVRECRSENTQFWQYSDEHKWTDVKIFESP